MDLGPLQRLATDLAYDAHAVAAVLYLPDGSPPIKAEGNWLQSIEDEPPTGREYNTREPRRIMALKRSAVPTQLPRGTIIDAPELIDGTPRRWQVDSFEFVEPHDIRVTLVPKTNKDP